MDELLDDETKKLFNELEKLLKGKFRHPAKCKIAEKMDRKEINLEKELSGHWNYLRNSSTNTN